MPERRETIDLTAPHVQFEGTPAALFVARTVENGWSRVKTHGWPTSAKSLGEIGEPVLHVAAEDHETGLFSVDGVLVHAGLYGGRVFASAAGSDEEEVANAIATLQRLLPRPDPSSAHEVTVTFWTYSPHGPQPSWRSIAVPEWAEIEDNYRGSTRDQLEALMSGFEPARGGQLILWHGIVGTGKTFALRALAWEWRRWCSLHYIVDPDSFFGQHADYLMNVLLQADPDSEWQMAMAPGIAPAVSPEVVGNGEPEKPWRVLILEDTGELLTPDAKATVGQGLSRFLNVVDGLIGQGLRVLVLVTTNEPLRRLHPAVARPGRCAANIEFESLTAGEATAWLERHGYGEAVTRAETLAALYARLEGRSAADEMPQAGFAG